MALAEACTGIGRLRGTAQFCVMFGRQKKKPAPPAPVRLERWAILFVGGKDTNREPKSCYNCPHMFSKQKTCEYMGDGISLEIVYKDGDLYTPVCGYQIGGKPVETDSPKYIGKKDPDELGLEWAKGKGTNCFGYGQGAPCRHFVPTEGEDGLCEAMLETDNEVDSDDCCAAHLGPSIPWKEAQQLIDA
jgi:hypothetical protein